MKKEGNCGASKGIGGDSHPESSLDKNVMLLEQMSKENIVYFKKTEMLKLEAPNATFGDIYYEKLIWIKCKMAGIFSTY